MQPNWVLNQRSARQHPMRQPACAAGLSLIELLIVLALAAILLGAAVPSFQSLMSKNQLTATTNTLVYSLQTTRSEAVKRAVAAGVCTSDNSLEPDATCSPGSGYVKGWIAYIDDDGNGKRNDSEEIIMAVEDRGPAFKINADKQFADQIYFDDAGGSANVAGVPLAGDINIAYGDGTNQRTVQVSANGRIATINPAKATGSP